MDNCEEYLGDEYQKLAHLQFGGGGTLQWISKDVPHTHVATGIYMTKKKCSFLYNVGKCPFVICKLFDSRTNPASIEIGTIRHTDHKLAKS